MGNTPSAELRSRSSRSIRSKVGAAVLLLFAVSPAAADDLAACKFAGEVVFKTHRSALFHAHVADTRISWHQVCDTIVTIVED